MEKQVLSIEQMQELKELGIDITSASMKWAPKLRWDENGEKREVYGHILDINYTPVGSPFWKTMDGKDTIPTFTLQDIIDMLPKRITISSNGVAQLMFNNEGVLEYHYIEYGELCASYHYTRPGTHLLDSAFDMLKWCKQNNYI